MDFLLKAVGLGSASPTKLIVKVLTNLAGSAVAPVVESFLLHRMNANSRVKLGDEMIAAGEALKAGRVHDASVVVGKIVDEIKP